MQHLVYFLGELAHAIGLGEKLHVRLELFLQDSAWRASLARVTLGSSTSALIVFSAAAEAITLRTTFQIP